MGFTDVTTQLADTDFSSKGKADKFQATQRSRIWVMMNASENVGGTMMFELDNIWGRDAAGMRGGSLGTDGVNIGVKEAYIDWKIPNSTIRVRMGLHTKAGKEEAAQAHHPRAHGPSALHPAGHRRRQSLHA